MHVHEGQVGLDHRQVCQDAKEVNHFQVCQQQAHVRCAHWNNYDLSTGEGVKLLLQGVDHCNPLSISVITECGPFSFMQNLNQRTEQQKLELAEKRREVMRQYGGASCVLHYAIQKGIHVTWEWSHKCHAWRLPFVQRIWEKYKLWVSVTNGCQVNLREPKSGKHLQRMENHDDPQRHGSTFGYALRIPPNGLTCSLRREFDPPKCFLYP